MKRLFAVIALTLCAISHAKTIEYHGDSTVYGTSMVGGVYVNQVQFPVPAILQGMIDRNCGAGVHTVINKGIGGDDDAALARYEKVKGYPYDFLSLISFLPALNARDSKRIYCYELTLHMMGGYVKWRVTPEIILYQLTIRK